MFSRCARFLQLAFAVAFSGLLIGCGSGAATVPYEGSVTLNGKPLAEATVTLLAIAANGPGPFSSVTDAEGKFSLGPTANPEERGVVPGEYRLMISTLKVAPNETGDDTAKPTILAKELVPEEYRTGNMRIEVPAEGTTSEKFEIMGRP